MFADFVIPWPPDFSGFWDSFLSLVSVTFGSWKGLGYYAAGFCIMAMVLFFGFGGSNDYRAYMFPQSVLEALEKGASDLDVFDESLQKKTWALFFASAFWPATLLVLTPRWLFAVFRIIICSLQELFKEKCLTFWMVVLVLVTPLIFFFASPLIPTGS